MAQISKEELEKLYLEEKKTYQQIGEIYGVGKYNIFKLIKKYGITPIKIPRDKLIVNKEKLIDLYYNQKKTTVEIAEELGVCRLTLRKWFENYGIVAKDVRIKDVPDKGVLEILYKDKTLDQIGEIFDVGRNVISKWMDIHGIERRELCVTKEVPDRIELEKLYFEDKLTEKQIGEKYGVMRNLVRKWFKGYGIVTRDNGTKYADRRGIKLTVQQREFLYGTLLGDGFMSENGRLRMCHCNKQRDYLIWKYELLKDFVPTGVFEYDQRDVGINSFGLKFSSITHPEFKEFRKKFYIGKDGKKAVPRNMEECMTAFSLAVLIMDDGWRNKRGNLFISSESFSVKDNQYLVDLIRRKFSIIGNVKKYSRKGRDYSCIYFWKGESLKLSELIGGYFVDCMRYKLV